MARRRDPLESAIESALQPGRFIGWSEETGFVAGLTETAREIAALMADDPARAVCLYETFIAACNLKAEEIDSEWAFGNFVADLARGWIQARQAAGADRAETAKILLSWMDRDNYGFFNDLGADAVKVLDRTGLAAFEKAVQERFEAASGDRKKQAGNSFSDQWGQILRSIYAQQRSVQKYLDLTALTGLTRGDCATIAAILQAKRKLNDALAWIERGLEIKDLNRSRSAPDTTLPGRGALCW